MRKVKGDKLSIDSVFPSDKVTYDDLACQQESFSRLDHLFLLSFEICSKIHFKVVFFPYLYSIGSKPLQIWDKKVCQ